MAQPRRLTRSSSDRLIAGVCGGLAEYFRFDPLLVRIAFVVGAVLAFSGVLLYFILWVVVPKDTSVSPLEGRPSYGSALQIAEERYARGEIDAEEFARIKEDLTR